MKPKALSHIMNDSGPIEKVTIAVPPTVVSEARHLFIVNKTCPLRQSRFAAPLTNWSSPDEKYHGLRRYDINRRAMIGILLVERTALKAVGTLSGSPSHSEEPAS